MASLPDIAGHTHDHVYLGSSHDANARRTLWVVALTAAMMVAEIAAGYLTGSMALLADGFHMATHAGALGVAAAAYAYAKRHAHSAAFSFGTGKVGDLAGFASAMVLGLIAFAIRQRVGPAPLPADYRRVRGGDDHRHRGPGRQYCQCRPALGRP